MSSETPDRSSATDGHRRDRQEVFVNRAIFTGIVVAAIAVVAIIIGRLVGGDSTQTATLTTSDEWNTAVVVTDDEVRLVDPATGEPTTTYEIGTGLLNSTIDSYGQTLVLLALNGQLTQLDLVDGSTEEVRSTRDGVLAISGGNRSVMAVGSRPGGEVTIVDTRTRTTIDVGDTAGLTNPRMFARDLRVNTAGSHAAISDADSFQTVLIDLLEGTTRLLGGQVGAINDASIVTVQRAGDQAELDVYDLTGDRIGTVDVPSPVAMMLTGDRSMVTVAGDGRITTVSSDGRTNEKGMIAGDGTATIRGGSAALADRRLVVEADDAVYLVDEDGDVVLAAPGQLLNEVGAMSECVIVGDGTSTGRSNQYDVDSGDALGTLNGGIVTATSYNGCTAAIIGGPTLQILADGESVPVEQETGSLTGVAPDGRAAVASSVSAGEKLIDASGDDDPVIVSTESSVVRFADLP